MTTSTTGVPVAATASSNCSCTPGRPSDERLAASPLILEWASDHVPAIVESWFLGIEAGNAIADVLFGDVNPSGRLLVTFPRVLGQVPLYYTHRPAGRPADASNKFTSKYIDVPVTPRYPFGYGLSYTTFAYSGLKLSAAQTRTDRKS